MSNVKYLGFLLDNHSKLISMISSQSLPIKQTLLDDVAKIKKLIENGAVKNEHSKPTTR